MRSMTGYGKAQAGREGISLGAEVKTVNHRYLDVSIRLPRNLSALEIALRKRLGEHFSRGRVELSILQEGSENALSLVSANLPLVQEYALAAQQIAVAAGIKNNLKLASLLALPEVLSLVPVDVEADLLLSLALEATDAACQAALEDRAREGEQLQGILLEHLDVMVQDLEALQAVANDQPLLARQRLEKRLATQPELAVDAQRLAQEIALFADRCDISEEINRLKAHCAQMKALAQQQGAIGRDMDFLAQEMNREANTICSKSASLEVTRLGLSLKGEADKIREQIQNVE